MNLDTDEMLQSYGLDKPFPEEWKDSGYSSALATLGNDPSSADENSSVLVDGLLGALTTSKSVAADEPDPLGSGMSIMELLAKRAQIVPSSAPERGVYIPSSTTFDPRRFLREVHGASSLSELEHGLAHLRRSMAGNETGLRKMVDTDYESYVASKRRLDEVVEQLNRVGVNEKTHFGMGELETRLIDASNQLTVRARPLDGIVAERDRLQNALRAIETHRNILELPQTLEKNLTAAEHDQFLRDFKLGQRLLKGMMSETASVEQQRLGLMVSDHVQVLLEKYREQLHTQLMKTPPNGAYAPLLVKLADLGVNSNPALEWLEHNIKRFSSDIDEMFNLLTTSATRNFADALESGKKLDLVTYLRNITPLASDVDELSELIDSSDIAIDSEGALQQWKQLVSSFENLRHILSRASAFYHEFASLSQRSTTTSTSLRFSKHEVVLVSRHFHDLLAMTGQRLVECLTAPIAKAAALPIASAHSRAFSDRSGCEGVANGSNGGASDTAAAGLADASDYLSFLPLNSNSLAVAKYLGRILEILNIIHTKATELAPHGITSNPLTESVAVVKQQFVKTLCECWTRDSMQLGKTQEWIGSAATRFPTYFVTYHGIIIEKLRYLMDAERCGVSPPSLLAHVEKIFPAALALSIRSVELALVNSSRNSIHGPQTVLNEVQLQPASLGQDAKLLVTLNNLETLKETSLEKIYIQFASSFKLKHPQAVRQEVTPEVDQISAQLFDIYIRKKRSRLSQVVHQETQRLLPSWRDDEAKGQPKREVRRVSNYVYECLMILVETHSLCVESCPQLTRHAVLELYSNLLTTILLVLRDTDTLSRFGTLQNIADLEFMRWALSQFPETTQTCQQIFDAIRRASTDSEVWSHPEGPRGLVLSVLDEAVRQSHFAFYCFKSFSKPK